METGLRITSLDGKWIINIEKYYKAPQRLSVDKAHKHMFSGGKNLGIYLYNTAKQNKALFQFIDKIHKSAFQ